MDRKNGMRRTILVVLGTLFAVAAAPEAWSDDDPKDCAAIPKDDARLECYDLIFRKSETQIPTTSAWIVQEETSKVDDSSNVYLFLDSSDTFQGRFGNTKHATLAIACREGKTNLWLHFDEHMTSHRGLGVVTYRIDKAAAKDREFTESNDNTALGLWSGSSAVPFAKQLFGGTTMLVRATPFSESTIQVEFPIAGIEQAIAPLRKACNW